MVIINEDKWDMIRDNFLSSVEYELTEEPLIYFDHKHNQEEEIGFRETYEFTKDNVDYMLILDKEYRLSKSTSEKDGKIKEHYQRSADEFTYKLSIKFRSPDGSWKDSASLEGNFEE